MAFQGSGYPAQQLPPPYNPTPYQQTDYGGPFQQQHLDAQFQQYQDPSTQQFQQQQQYQGQQNPQQQQYQESLYQQPEQYPGQAPVLPPAYLPVTYPTAYQQPGYGQGEQQYNDQQQQYPQQLQPGFDEQQGLASAGPASAIQQPAPPSARPGFFARLFGREAAPPVPAAVQAAMPNGQPGVVGDAVEPDLFEPMLHIRDAEDDSIIHSMLVSYSDTARVREDDATINALVLSQFDKDGLGRPAPLAQRLEARKPVVMPDGAEGTAMLPHETFGLYTEQQCILNERSLYKMEQRLTKRVDLDRVMLAQVAARFGAPWGTQQHASAVVQQEEQKQMVVGNLPTVAEEPEGAAGDAMQTPRQRSETGAGLQAELQQNLPGMASPSPPPQNPRQSPAYPEEQPAPAFDPTDPYGQQFLYTLLDTVPGTEDEWLDETGCMRYLPDPLKALTERPARWYDQDKDTNRSVRVSPIVEAVGLSSEAHKMYRLDIELGRLEFSLHPLMAREDLLAAQLLTSFREFKRRECVGLAPFYLNKLSALEEALLAARERLFQLQASEASEEDVMEAYTRTAKLEREVAEMRQLKEDEQRHMLQLVEALEALYRQLQAQRDEQGYWLTNVQLTVQRMPPEELLWIHQRPGGASREGLDTALLLAEEEPIAGLPPYPAALPVPAYDAEDLGPFRLRRIESMCAAHAATFGLIKGRLDTFMNRPSSDPSDPLALAMTEQLSLLGKAPRRMALTDEQMQQARANALQRVRSGLPGVPTVPRMMPVITIGGEQPEDLQPPPASRVSKTKYLAKLLVNGRVVDTSSTTPLTEDFTLNFKDVFSVQVVRWPESICLQLLEVGLLTNKLVALIYINIPGLAGSPHVDALPKPYHFTSSEPFKPANMALIQAQHEAGVPPDQRHSAFSAAASPLVYPSGALFVRCGWVSDLSALSQSLASTVGAGGAIITYDNPLANDEEATKAADARRQAGPVGAAEAALAATSHLAVGVEAGRSLMPPLPPITVDRMLRRAADRIGGKANRALILRWLSDNVIDPSDPRNAALLELLKAQEAVSGAASDLFRLDIFPDVALDEDRMLEKRFAFLMRRWQSGPFRDPEKSILKGMRAVRIPAVLSGRDAEDLEHLYLDALNLIELAPGGSGPALARAIVARQDRAMRLQQGELHKPIEEREARIRDFGLRVRGAASRLGGRSAGARKYKTDDVVNDVPLPEFKLSVSNIFAFVEPRRPLRRSRAVVQSLLTSVPRDTQLIVSLQRLSNLPGRIPTSTTSPSRRSPSRRRRDTDQDDDDEPSSAGSTSMQVFCEVRFRGVKRRTNAVGGEFPMFNEQLMLPVFGAEEEPSPSALFENADLVTINVFDEVIVDRGLPRAVSRREGAGISDPVRVPQRERRFLGCLRVPLSTVYQVQVLEGTFRLEQPPVLLGYALPPSVGDRPATIGVYMTLQPRLFPSVPAPEETFSGESDDITRHAVRWLAGLTALPQCRTRIMRITAVDPSGMASLLCRYVAPTLLPPSLRAAADTIRAGGTVPPMTQAVAVAESTPRDPADEDEERGERDEVRRDEDRGSDTDARPDVDAPAPTPVAPVSAEAAASAAKLSGTEAVLLKLARFVSLVPFIDDSGLQKRRHDVWTTTAEFLHLAAGDHEEHAHCLAGYFLQCGQQAFVVLGASMMGAKSAFVLTTGAPATADGDNPALRSPVELDELKLRLWNPINGMCCSVKDPTCEMREVGVIYDWSNVWANIQQAAQPWGISWDLRNHMSWRPFFGKELAARELATLQHTPVYKDLPQQFYQQLEARVEDIVRDCLSRERSREAVVTNPDNKLSRVLKALLRSLPASMEAVTAASLAYNTSVALLPPGQAPPQPVEHRGDRFRLMKQLQADHNARVRRETATDMINGHVLAVPFSDRYMDAVEEAVLNTSIHRIADPRVKYAIAAMVEPAGSEFVCTMWIYVAAIRDR